jgi:hypothetical protein
VVDTQGQCQNLVSFSFYSLINATWTTTQPLNGKHLLLLLPWHQKSCLPFVNPPQFLPPWLFGMGKMPFFLPGEWSRELKMEWLYNSSPKRCAYSTRLSRAVKMILDFSF